MNIKTPAAWQALYDLIAVGLPLALLAALGGIVRSMQAGRCGFKAVAVAATTSLFAGVIVHLILAQTDWPLSIQGAIVGLSGYASGELLKIMAVRVCKWAETVGPGVGK